MESVHARLTGLQTMGEIAAAELVSGLPDIAASSLSRLAVSASPSSGGRAKGAGIDGGPGAARSAG
jgi:hypothetical protein